MTADLMRGMSVSHVRFVVRVLDGIVLEGQPGSALRGALFAALSSNFCSEPGEFHTAGHQDRCPVCWLLAKEAPGAARGANLPRPLVIEPPSARHYRRGETFTFGITLIGKAQSFFPFVARAVQKMGSVGLGVGRGRFRLVSITEYSPLIDAERVMMDAQIVKSPTLQVTPARIAEVHQELQHVFLHFFTPTRLIAENRLVKSPEPRVLLQRLIERCQRLTAHYAETDNPPTAEEWRAVSEQLCQRAQTWRIGYDTTEWSEAFSGSHRQGRITPISGFIGMVRWDGDIGEAYPWLLWGQSLHVGKDAVKGNGWYRIMRGVAS